ncbi:MAG: cobalamin-binding protein [Nitrospiraceae bacterium]
MRICSLLPGATEIVAALGLADELVGISHECDYPEMVRTKPVMVRSIIDSACFSIDIDRQVREKLHAGQSLYELNETLFLEAQPDLIITQDLCQVCAVTPNGLRQAIDALPRKPDLLALNPTTLDEVIADVGRIGEATARRVEAQQLAAALRSRLAALREHVNARPNRPRVLCLEWLSPLYIGGHWVPDMVEMAGGVDVLGTSGVPSRKVTWKHIHEAEPDMVVLMPCGFSVTRAQQELGQLSAEPEWKRLPAVQADRVFVVDAAAYFSRPGPRLVDGVEQLASVFHPALAQEGRPRAAHRIQALHDTPFS